MIISANLITALKHSCDIFPQTLESELQSSKAPAGSDRLSTQNGSWVSGEWSVILAMEPI